MTYADNGHVITMMSMAKYKKIKLNNMENIFEVGDTVRFVCYKFDEDGRMTDRLMKVTGKLVEIEPAGSCPETSFPLYWVVRNGKLLWYSGDNLMLIKKQSKNK